MKVKKRKISLRGQNKEIANAKKQLDILASGKFKTGELPTFSKKVKDSGHSTIRPISLDIFQINLGYICNQTCEHCHIDAGPDRKEIMSKETMLACLNAVMLSGAKTVDLTGGAPEMNPNFKWFVEELSKLDIEEIIVRSNLTILVSHSKYSDLPKFFKDHQIHVISSLPCYTQENVDNQRGTGVFSDSIKALKILNDIGYGTDSKLKLDLVYNPVGPSLPGPQDDLERDYKKQLSENFGINFNHLFTITNLPINRFLDFLIASERYDEYMVKLIDAFNPYTLDNIMCTNTISIDYNGAIYDCDFNQVLHLKNTSKIQNVKDFNLTNLMNRNIAISQHCYGCTAGAGSSCQGAVV